MSLPREKSPALSELRCFFIVRVGGTATRHLALLLGVLGFLARQAIVVDPEFWIGYLQLGQACEQLGNNDLALDALQNAGRFGGGNSKVIALRT